jgi:hypothetical protein
MDGQWVIVLAMSTAAENQRRYRQRRNAEQLVLRCPAAHDTLLDLFHAAGITVRDPTRETLETCLVEFLRRFEDGTLIISRRGMLGEKTIMRGIT